ncbi:MAG: serine/threonine protein kinase [Chloroflexi bacterium]|nr:serine/threonine protein kinase [Chloroflexota bacterium]
MNSSLPNNTILRERYKLTNIVGQGGMGSVYRAEDLRLPGRLCAIKEVQPDPDVSLKIQVQGQEQFLKEASILAQLDHPSLPKVSDFFSDNGRDYLVMDYVPGDDLRQRLKKNNGRLPVKIVCTWASQILEALHYLHTQSPPVLHRDIKPANIKLTPDGRIKLVDFGLVKLMATDDVRTITVVQGRGTALYTPLEQYGSDSGHTDVRTDIYAVGATLYHLLTDSPPPNAKARFLNPAILISPDDLNSELSPYISDAILWAMEMHPDERPSTINEFRQALFGIKSRPGKKVGLSKVSELGRAIYVNRIAIVIVVCLFILAIILTIL